MEGTRQYKSKYSKLSMKEYKELRNIKYKEWLKKCSQEQLDSYKNKKIQLCPTCNKTYADIYQHMRTKKHKKCFVSKLPCPS